MAFDDSNTVESPDARPSSVDLSTSPWLIRVFDRVPLSLPAMGMLFALAYFLSVTMLALALSLPRDLGLDIFVSIALGYMVGAGYYGLREAVRDFISLRPALSCDDIEFEHWLTRLRHVARAPLHIVTAFALVVGFNNGTQDGNWTDLGSAQVNLDRIDNFLQVFVFLRFFALELISAFLFAQVARRFARIELLDFERIAPFTRRALRGVLVLMLYSVILSIGVTSVYSFEVFLGDLGVILVAVTSLIAAATFLIPLYPLHRRIDATKRAELAHVREAIRRESDARTAGEKDWAPPDARLTHLVSYKRQIEQVSTWAVNTPTVARFALYVSLGIGSWLGAALVERWLGTLLGS